MKNVKEQSQNLENALKRVEDLTPDQANRFNLVLIQAELSMWISAAKNRLDKLVGE